MPKRNPKHQGRTERLYRRAQATRRFGNEAKDRAPYYFALIFAGVVAGIFILIWALNQDYSGQITVREGDVVWIDYVGTYPDNGTIFDSGEIPSHTVGGPGLLEYFDQELVGCIPGVKKTFVVPAEFGYTNPGDKLYGEDLKFEVTITKIERDGEVIYPE